MPKRCSVSSKANASGSNEDAFLAACRCLSSQALETRHAHPRCRTAPWARELQSESIYSCCARMPHAPGLLTSNTATWSELHPYPPIFGLGPVSTPTTRDPIAAVRVARMPTKHQTTESPCPALPHSLCAYRASNDDLDSASGCIWVERKTGGNRACVVHSSPRFSRPASSIARSAARAFV